MHKVTIVGGGTAGLVNALMLKTAFPNADVSIVESSKIGIIGVGEGSTEHWKYFMETCGISLGEMLIKTKATHKNGIRFENWTEHTPDYMHSVSSVPEIRPFNVLGLYAGLVQDGKTLTENIAPRGIIENMVPANNPHESVNQYHFDTFKLNEYLHELAFFRGIKIIDGDVVSVNHNLENGHIESVLLEDNQVISSDIWIDASGTKRVLISTMEGFSWRSFRKYLQMNAAIAFPTEADPSGQIRPYTRARATKNGWMWEIPTQERRGNGYVFCSDYMTTEEAAKEASIMTGYEVEPARQFDFDPGCLEKMWVKNCIAVGICSSFVEPIEATSIGSTIQQARAIIENVFAYKHGDDSIPSFFNKKMSVMMENIVSMISLHYVSDRRDSEMWKNQASMAIPEYLQELLDIWAVRPPVMTDISSTSFEMFLVPHFYHVAQGQKLIGQEGATSLISSMGIEDAVKNAIFNAKIQQSSHPKVDHAQALREIQI